MELNRVLNLVHGTMSYLKLYFHLQVTMSGLIYSRLQVHAKEIVRAYNIVFVVT